MRWYRAGFPGLLLMALLGGGCNLFTDTAGIGAKTADEHILEGQILLQKAKYTEAESHFLTAIKIDSSKSEGYYGAAKCELLNQHINMFKLVQSFQENDGKSIPFLGEPDSVKDKIYVANNGINRYLNILVDREKAGKSDGKVPVRSFSADFALSSAIEAILSLADFNSDGRIDFRDNILNGIIDFTDPSKLNPDSIMANIADLKNDTIKIAALNNLLGKSQELLAKSDKAIDLFLNSVLDKSDTLGNCPPSDTVCQKLHQQTAGLDKDKVGDSAIVQVKKFIQDAGSTMLIYKVFDREDNDGDGCIDEEFLDGIDNDGDARIDEDSRGAPDSIGNAHFYADKDGADNNLNGKNDETAEAEFHLRYLKSFEVVPLLLHPDRKGQIFWSAGGTGSLDTRKMVLVMLDSTASPKLVDSVTTYDLCTGPVTGFKKAK